MPWIVIIDSAPYYFLIMRVGLGFWVCYRLVWGWKFCCGDFEAFTSPHSLPSNSFKPAWVSMETFCPHTQWLSVHNCLLKWSVIAVFTVWIHMGPEQLHTFQKSASAFIFFWFYCTLIYAFNFKPASQLLRPDETGYRSSFRFLLKTCVFMAQGSFGAY